MRQRGFRFIALADDNFYPVTLADLEQASRQSNGLRLEELLAAPCRRLFAARPMPDLAVPSR